MKIATKIFISAFAITLCLNVFCGIFFVKASVAPIWESGISRAQNMANNAFNSLSALANATYGEIPESSLAQVEKSLAKGAKSAVIYTSKTVPNEYSGLKSGECLSKFDNLVLKTVCLAECNGYSYYIEIKSDFSEIQKQSNSLWHGYFATVAAIALLSGALLYFVIQRTTSSLNLLVMKVDKIAEGKLHQRISLKTSDRETETLAKSFNLMSEAIEQKMSEIEQEIEKRDMFVANFTHELKTPMTSIIGYSKMLNTYDLDETEKKSALETVYREAKRLERLSAQLLELYVYKNESPKMSLVSLHDIGENLKSTLKISAQKYEVELDVDLKYVSVEANSELLLSLLYNLADNAFKASNPQGKVKIYSQLNEKAVKLTVEDNGRGIEKESLALLTEPFFREDKARARSLGGAGLGLALCREIANMHGTELLFESQKGLGTRVSFVLKRGEAQ